MPPKKLVKKMNASGKRRVSAPLTRSVVLSGRAPQIKSLGNGRILVKHRELLDQVTGSILFDNDSFPINPGLVTTFPWLSSIARDYEKYIFRKLHFSYVPRTAATVVGGVILACDFDAADSLAGSAVELMNYHGSVSGNAWTEMEMDFEKMNPVQDMVRYIRYDDLASNLDIKLYDVCSFQYGREGFVGTDVCGYLFVDYECEFIIPQIHLNGDTYILSSTSTDVAPFNAVTSETGLIFANVDGDELVCQCSGTYRMVLTGTGTVFILTQPTVEIAGASTGVTLIAGGINAAATSCIWAYDLVMNKGQLLHLDFSPACDTLTALTTRISRV